VARTIRVELKKIKDIVQVDYNLSRVEQIAQRKQAIYQYRNQCLSEQRQMIVDDHAIALSETGKPYWVGQPSFHFNHSHSQNYYALAMSEKVADLGVDVEELSRKVRFGALAQHAFHVDELELWQQVEQEKSYWFKVWTTKEAVLKASGLGIRLNLNELNTQAHPMHNGGMCNHPLIGSFAYQNFELGDVMLTVAWRAEQSCRGYALPQIELIQQLHTDIKKPLD